ncbi:MAG TPA: ABC transporter permease [Treponemataceae bacterium]|nr:ABC transporter permease [Treponemataceae bacterium]HQL03710.1 ABC transporter permease [Treponemataceae bacterium]
MFEDLYNALQNFRLNKARTILSLLGVIIGVASVIIITTLGQSATQNIKGSFGSSGLDIVRLNAGFANRRVATGSSITFNEDFRTELWDNIPHLKGIYYNNTLSGTVGYGDVSVSSSITAIEYEYLEMNKFELENGSFFTVSDSVQGLQKIIIGSEVASTLFSQGDAVGKTVILISSNIRFGFEVIGVLKEQSSGFESTASALYIPRGFYDKKISPSSTANSVVIQLIDQSYATEVVDLIKSYADTKTGQTNSMQVTSMQSMLEQYDEVMGTVSLLLSGIAAISLLVGGIGIMNIMIVTVTERRKEIGIRKALGATPNAIRMQFLVESATISLFGGVFGIIFGLVLSAVATYVMDWAYAVQWSACLIAFLFSAFVGVFFGLNPAARAAKLDPVEALASE